MASIWGKSFGSAFGNAWGQLERTDAVTGRPCGAGRNELRAPHTTQRKPHSTRSAKQQRQALQAAQERYLERKAQQALDEQSEAQPTAPGVAPRLTPYAAPYAIAPLAQSIAPTVQLAPIDRFPDAGETIRRQREDEALILILMELA